MDKTEHTERLERIERLEAVRGLAEGKSGVDRENHVIRGVAIATLGVAKDRRLEVDEVFLNQVVEKGNAWKKGLRSRFDHPQASSTSMGTYVGRLKNFRRDGAITRADLHLANVAGKSPNGDLRGYIEDLAEEDPDAFGISLVLEKSEVVHRLDDDGKPLKDENGEEIPPLWRIKKLWAGDVVDEPDINNGMLSILGTPAQKAAAFMDRFLKDRGLTIVPVEGATPAGKETNMGNKVTEVGAPATPANPTTPAPATEQPKPAPARLSEEERRKIEREAAQKAIARHGEILNAAKLLGLSSENAEVKKILEGELDTAEACRALLGVKGRQPESKPAVIPVAEVLCDESDKFRTAAQTALEIRAGLLSADEFNKLPAERRSAVQSLRRRSLYAMAELCVERARLAEAVSADRMGIAALALHSTSDFPLLLENIGRKAMLKAYNETPSTWERWCQRGETSDFKKFTRLRVSEADDLLLVPEGSEYQDSTITEGREQGQAFTYGRTFAVTRQLIINDDMGQITKQPMRFGQAARRLVGDLVYSLLMSGAGAMGPTMGDGNTLFIDSVGGTVANGNWFDDGDVPAGNSTLDLTNGQAAIQFAKLLLARKTGPLGKQVLNLTPKVLLIPPELEMAARILVGSSATVTADLNAGVINPWRGLAEIVTEHRLSAASFTGYSTTAWYLIADPAQVDTFEVTFLDGNDQPAFEEDNDFRTDGRAYKVRLDVGVTALDRAGLVKSKGAA